MQKLVVLLILLNMSISAYAVNLEAPVNVPKYLWIDFDAEDYHPSDVENMIKTYGFRHVYLPTPIEDLKPNKLKAPKVNKEGITLVHISNNAAAQTETWATVNPLDNNQIIATSNDNLFNGRQGQYRMSAYYSHDGGKTWDYSLTDNHNSNNVFIGGNTIFDPIITFNHLGEVFYGYGYTDIINGTKDGQNGLFASMSFDAGQSWTDFDQEDIIIVAESDGGGDGFHDRYSIAADWWSEDYKGNIYIAWRFFKDGKGIEFARSTYDDEYYEWDDESITSFEGTQAPVPAVGPNGEVYVTWRQSVNPDRTQAPLVVSYDGGRNFESHSIAMENWNIGALPENLPSYARVSLPKKDSMRISTNPLVAVDVSESPRRGWVYIVQPGKEGGRTGPNRMYLAVLKDPSTTAWQTIRIDNNEFGNDMFLPSICVDPVTGYVFVFYYSSQNDINNELVDAYVAYSYDGQNFKHKRISDESFLVKAAQQADDGNRYWGDYTSITGYDNKIYPVFWMPISPTGSYGTLDLYTALISTAPAAPELAVQNGNEVTISWDNIVDGLGEPVTEYTIRVYKNDVLVDEFEQNVTSYTDTNIEINDEIKYGVQIVSKDARGEGEIGEVNVIIGGELETLAPTDLTAYPSASGLRLSWKNPSLSIDGATFDQVDAINIYHDGTLLERVEQNVLNAGEIVSHVTMADTEMFYDNIYITAVRTRNGEEAESVPSNSVLAYAGAPLGDFSEGFEDSENMIPTITNGNWATTDKGGFESATSLTDSPVGDYDREENSMITFAPFVLRSTDPLFVFDHIAIVDDKDFASIEISSDFAKTWRPVFSSNIIFGDGFGDTFEESDWVQAGIDLIEEGFNDGDTLFVRATLVSNSISADDGVYFDNFQLANDSDLRDGNLVSVEELRSNSLSVAVSPNPAENHTIIEFSTKFNDMIELEIFDNLGNRVANVFANEFTPGFHKYDLDLSEYTSGIYYARISNGREMVSTVINVCK